MGLFLVNEQEPVFFIHQAANTVSAINELCFWNRLFIKSIHSAECHLVRLQYFEAFVLAVFLMFLSCCYRSLRIDTGWWQWISVECSWCSCVVNLVVILLFCFLFFVFFLDGTFFLWELDHRGDCTLLSHYQLLVISNPKTYNSMYVEKTQVSNCNTMTLIL